MRNLGCNTTATGCGLGTPSAVHVVFLTHANGCWSGVVWSFPKSKGWLRVKALVLLFLGCTYIFLCFRTQKQGWPMWKLSQAFFSKLQTVALPTMHLRSWKSSTGHRMLSERGKHTCTCPMDIGSVLCGEGRQREYYSLCINLGFYILSGFVRSKWQTLWDVAVNNKLHAIQPSLGLWPGSRRNTCREEVVLARIRLGHTYLTHSYLLNREDQPECVGCACPLTVQHIRIDCVKFTYMQNRFSMLQTWNISSIQLHLQQSNCTLELLDFFQDVTWRLALDFALIWP